MGRVSYELSAENRRRIDLLVAFGIINGSSTTKEQLVNESIRTYFVNVYRDYCNRTDANDYVKSVMEESLRIIPSKVCDPGSPLFHQARQVADQRNRRYGDRSS